MFLYDASVPVFVRYLGRLSAMLDAAALHMEASGRDASELLDARLHDDMLPFASQVQIAANFSLRAAYPLAGLPIPPYGDFADTLAGLQSRLSHVRGLLESLPAAAFDAAESRILESQAGSAFVVLPAPEFLFQYALPNFFFHVMAAYSILRSRGVAIGKADFDGFHVYGKKS